MQLGDERDMSALVIGLANTAKHEGIGSACMCAATLLQGIDLLADEFLRTESGKPTGFFRFSARGTKRVMDEYSLHPIRLRQ